MELHLIIALFIYAMSSIVAETFPTAIHSSSVHPPESRPAWSYSAIEYTRPSWPATTPTWSPSLYTSDTWSTVIWPLPSSPLSPSPPTLTWQPDWSTSDQPDHSSSWPSIHNPPNTWSSGAPAWSHTWPSTAAWPAPSPQPPPPPPATLPSLNDALIAAGAAQFAALIQSDPVVSAAYAEGVPTVFAPTDQFIGSAFNVSQLGKRATLTPLQQQQLLLHAAKNQSEINGLRTPPGTVIPTKDSTANLGGGTQKVVSDPRKKTNSTKSTNGKRWLPFILPRQDNNSSETALVNIFSGLGDAVGIVTGNIPYAGGVIHTTNGKLGGDMTLTYQSLFTVPFPLSSTAQSTGQTTFVSLTNVSSQTSILDAIPLITVFIPTNDAFAAAGISTASSGIAPALAGHVLRDVAGYIPTFTNGSSFVTAAGTTITVTIQGDDYFVNNAKIVSSNLILQNGVAHVIDSVLKLPIAPYTGAVSSYVRPGVTKSLLFALGVTLSLAWPLWI